MPCCNTHHIMVDSEPLTDARHSGWIETRLMLACVAGLGTAKLALCGRSPMHLSQCLLLCLQQSRCGFNWSLTWSFCKHLYWCCARNAYPACCGPGVAVRGIMLTLQWFWFRYRDYLYGFI